MHWTHVVANVAPWFLLVVGFGRMTLALVLGRTDKVRRDESPLIYWTLTLLVYGGAGLVGFLMLTGLLWRMLGFP
jgi:hypothetical protein